MSKYNNNTRKTYNRLICLLICIVYAISVNAQSKKSDNYFAKGMNAYNEANYFKAIKYFSKAKELDEKQLSPNTSRKYYTDSWIAYCYYNLGNNTKAKKYSLYYYFIEPIDRRNTIASDKEYNLATEALENLNLDEALDHAIKCKELEANTIGKETLHYLGSCELISHICNLKNDYVTAIEYCEEGLSLLKKMKLDTAPYTFWLLHNRVDAYLGLNTLLMADNDILQMKSICEYQEVENGDKLFTAIMKIQEGRIELLKKGDKDKVIKLATDAFYLLIDNYSPENDATDIMVDCFNLLDKLGAHKLQIELLESALEKELIPLHRGVLLAHLAALTTDTDTAIKSCKEANSLLKNGSFVSIYYNNLLLLADLYTDKDNFDEAIEIYKQVCNHSREFAFATKTYSFALEGLGDIYMKLGQPQKAAVQYETLINLFRQNKADSEYAIALCKGAPALLTTLSKQNSPESMVKIQQIGQEIQFCFQTFNHFYLTNSKSGALGVTNAILHFIEFAISSNYIPNGMSWQNLEKFLTTLIYNELIPTYTLKNSTTCRALYCLVFINWKLGNYNQATSLFNQVIDVSKEEGYPYNRHIANFAFLQYDSGNTYSAFESFKIGYELHKEEFLSKFRWMSIDERTAFTNAQRSYFDNIVQYAAITPDDSRYAELAYDVLLFTKGLLLNSTIELNRLLQEEGDQETLRLLEQWRTLNQQLQSMESAQNDATADLRKQVNIMEKQLVVKSKTFGDYTKNLTITFKDIQNNLNAEDIAIEFCSYQRDMRARHYGAIILTKDRSPIYVDIGNNTDWQHIDIIDECYNSDMLFNLMFTNLKKYLPAKEKGNVYFAADGMLHNIAIENLP